MRKNSRPKVYIASPYRLGNKEKNVIRSMEAADDLISAGYTPFIPLLNHYMDAHFKQSEKYWLEYDLEWLPTCQAVLRLSGESKGADAEVKLAKKLGIPVFYSVEDIGRAGL